MLCDTSELIGEFEKTGEEEGLEDVDWYAERRKGNGKEKEEEEETECNHQWAEGYSEDICEKCGLVGQPRYSYLTSDTSLLPSPPETSPSDFISERTVAMLRDEITEIIMRISGGDCAMQHVDCIMDKLAKWYKDGGQHLRERICRIGRPGDSISRGILALAVQLGLLYNGRAETVEFISTVVGASRHSVQMAEKVLKVSRSYVSNPVNMDRIVSSLEKVDRKWQTGISLLANFNSKRNFKDMDVTVASCALALGRRVRDGLNSRGLNKSRKVELRKQLRHVSGAALCRALHLTYSTVNRAALGLEEETKKLVSLVATQLY